MRAELKPTTSTRWPCLSLKQPWLFAIFELQKQLENRKWPAHRRGPIWLHAAKGFSFNYLHEAYQWMTPRGLGSLFSGPQWPGIDKTDRGGVCGYAELDGLLYPDGHPMAASTLAAFRSNVPNADEMLRWRMPEQFSLVLKNVKRFPSIRCKGAQRWFYLPPEIERVARAAVLDDVCVCESEIDDIGPGHLASCRFSDPNCED
jgi:hypothetical protein